MKDVVAVVFGFGMILNVAPFIPQAVHLWRTKTSRGGMGGTNDRSEDVLLFLRDLYSRVSELIGTLEVKCGLLWDSVKNPWLKIRARVEISIGMTAPPANPLEWNNPDSACRVLLRARIRSTSYTKSICGP